jgi:hypothetical protein
MHKRRVQGSSRKTRSSDQVVQPTSKCLRFLGVSLSGGKSDKACLAVIEYYPEGKKVFLSKMLEKIKTEEFISADLKIHEIIHQYGDEIERIAFDVPLTLPKCLICSLKCPGYEVCDEEEIKYIRHIYHQETDKKKPKKMYTPYTQRCIEAYLSVVHPELEVQHAMGANMAPMTARARYILRRIKQAVLEVFPKLSVWRLGQELKVNKTYLRTYRNSVGGNEARQAFLSAMADKAHIFFYQQDLRSMTENYHAFEAFICAYTAYLEFQGQAEARPKDFPKQEKWITAPAEK